MAIQNRMNGALERVLEMTFAARSAISRGAEDSVSHGDAPHAKSRVIRLLTMAATLAILGVPNYAAAQPQTAGVAVAGGIGAWERAQLSDNPVPSRNVKLVFSLDTGNYVADVHVKVIASDGEEIVNGLARGPWVYATLPPGRYTVMATYANETLTQQVAAVDGARRRVHFTWPANVEESVAANVEVTPILGTGAQRAVR